MREKGEGAAAGQGARSVCCSGREDVPEEGGLVILRRVIVFLTRTVGAGLEHGLPQQLQLQQAGAVHQDPILPWFLSGRHSSGSLFETRIPCSPMLTRRNSFAALNKRSPSAASSKLELSKFKSFSQVSNLL